MITEESKKIRQDRDTDIIVNTLLEELPEKPLAILLYGGYGRGEGAWFEDDNGNTTPYNDYDIDVITNHVVSHSKRQSLRKDLAKKVGIKWIDLGFISPQTIRKYKATIQTIDLKEASTLLYGDNSVYELFPEMKREDIGEFDIQKLFNTRVWTFLGSWHGPFHDLDIEEARFFKNQMAKATLASCDLFLIKNRCYVTSYKDRAQKAIKLYPENEKLKGLANWAIHEKLHPSSDCLKEDDMKTLYIDVKSIFCEAMSIAYEEKWNYYMNATKLKGYLYYHSFRFVKAFVLKILGKKYNIEKNIDIICAQNYTFQAWNNGIINEDYIKKASEILRKWKYISRPISDWDELRIAVSEARNNI